MSIFDHFNPPGMLDELSGEAQDAWSTMLAEHTTQFAFVQPRYFDPTDAAVTVATPVSIIWSASPARLRLKFNDPDRWQAADLTRDEQDEYCEWRVERDPDGRLTAVTFSTEVPEYWAHVAEHDQALLLDLYHRLVSPEVVLEDLLNSDHSYREDNRWNNATSDGIAHLRQGSNTLLAALNLAADSTVQRVDAGGKRVEERRSLIMCGRLGEPDRNSDPQIADIINDAVNAGSAVSLANPLGLYLDGIQAAGLHTPDGTDPATFWTVQRGEPGHAVRARFEVPAGHGYVLGDITLDGRPVEFGTQLADKVRVRIDALLSAGQVPAVIRPCEA